MPDAPPEFLYKRVLLKVSGEVLMGDQAYGIDMKTVATVAQAVAEPYVRRRALRHLEKGRVVIFAAGVGAPFFTTDSGAALRAAEMGCDALLKGTSVDGVYTADPKKDKTAQRFDKLTYLEVLSKDLKVMDASAISLMRESGIPIVVFSIRKRGELLRVLTGQGVHTVIAG